MTTAIQPEKPEAKIEEVHSMRLSIEIPTIKDMQFQANIGLSYTLPLLGDKNFSTTQPTNISKSGQALLKGTFSSYSFEATKSELYSALSTTDLIINIESYVDNSSKIIGICKIPLKELIGSNATLDKTERSAVRAYDAELPVLNQENQKIATLRFTAYLEDFGAVLIPQPKQVENQEKESKENDSKISNQPANIQKTKEYEALWQLEMWKKAEEAKFNAYLKEKSSLHLAEIIKEFKIKEEQREHQLQEATENVKKLQQQMIKKAKDLEKREQKIGTLEDDLRKKIGEVTKQLSAKEEEIISVKTKCKEEKQNLEKEKIILTEQLNNLKEQLAEINDKYNLLKKELNESSMSTLKQEISQKDLEVIELEKKLEKSAQAKELYKAQYEKIKEEIIRIRESTQQAKEAELKHQAEEIEKLRYQVAMPFSNKTMPVIQNIEEPMLKTSKIQQPQQAETYRQSARKDEGTARQSIYIQMNDYQTTERNPLHNENPIELKTELDRLMNEKQELLESGLYTESDEIIKTLNSQIAEALKN